MIFICEVIIFCLGTICGFKNKYPISVYVLVWLAGDWFVK